MRSFNSQKSFQWGLTNFDFSALWVRYRKLLTDALDVTPPFLRSKQSDAGERGVLYLFSILILFPRYRHRLSQLALGTWPTFPFFETMVCLAQLRS